MLAGKPDGRRSQAKEDLNPQSPTEERTQNTISKLCSNQFLFKWLLLSLFYVNKASEAVLEWQNGCVQGSCASSVGTQQHGVCLVSCSGHLGWGSFSSTGAVPSLPGTDHTVPPPQEKPRASFLLQCSPLCALASLIYWRKVFTKVTGAHQEHL